MKLSVLLLLFVASACRADLEITSGDVTVLVGEDATIPCKFDTEETGDATITWSVRQSDGTPPKRLFVANIGDPTKSHPDTNAPARSPAITADGEGSLLISSTTIDDNVIYGKLVCEVEVGLYKISKNIDFLAALLPTDEPDMTLSDYDQGKDGFDVQDSMNIGTCISAKSYPAATVTFYEYGKSLPVSGGLGILSTIMNSATVVESDDGVSKLTSNELIKSINISDHQAEFTCNIKTIYGDQVYEKNYTMPKFNVNFKPTMVKFDDPPMAYLGETITLKCSANGYPAPEISINDVPGSMMEITVTKELNGNEYVCKARNSLMTESEESFVSEPYVLNVLSLDKPTLAGNVIHGDTQVTDGEEISVDCSAEGNPSPTVAWYKGDEMVSEDGTLNIPNAMFTHSGYYSCRAVNGHEKLAIATDLHVEVNGLKLDGELEESVTGKKGETVPLTCAASGNPKPSFEWSVEADAVPSTTNDYSYTSQIQVGPLTPELSEKEYTCTVTGYDGFKITKTFKLPEIAAGSSSTVIIIVILVLILVVAVVLAVLYNKGIICKKSEEKGEESAEGDIEAAMNNDDDAEAGNGKATQPADDEEEQPATSNPDEEKLMAGNED